MRTIKTSAVLAAALLGMFVGTARAQETVVAKVPFPFVVRGEEFAAGRYGISTEEGVLSIRGLDNGGGGFAMTRPADGRDPAGSEPSLVFIRYENQYLLSEIWDSSTEGFAIPEESATPKHQRADAQSAAPSVVLVANLK
jgi:hypothetical protein